MLKTFRNIFIATSSGLGFSYVYRVLLRKKGPLVRAIVFHDVHDAEWFNKIITYAQEQYHIISPEDFLQKHFNPVRINVLITFDDGYASWVDVCLPILAEKNIHALFFVNSGLIDLHGDAVTQGLYVHDRLMLSPRTTLSWDGVKQLVRAGHTIGGHTITHLRLSELSEDMQRVEITQDKERIEEMLGIPVSTFAYPFGQKNDYSSATAGLVQEAGFVQAYTTEGLFADCGGPYSISRLCIEDGQTTISFKRFVEGGYDLYAKVKSLV